MFPHFLQFHQFLMNQKNQKNRCFHYFQMSRMNHCYLKSLMNHHYQQFHLFQLMLLMTNIQFVLLDFDLYYLFRLLRCMNYHYMILHHLYYMLLNYSKHLANRKMYLMYQQFHYYQMYLMNQKNHCFPQFHLYLENHLIQMFRLSHCFRLNPKSLNFLMSLHYQPYRPYLMFH